MKKIATLLIALFFVTTPFAGGFTPARATEEVNLYFFWGEGCPHCAKEKPFLEKLGQKYPQLNIHELEVWGNRENLKLMVEFGKKLDATVSGVPFTVVGEHYISGWMDEAYTGGQIEEAIQCAIQNSCRDIGNEIANGKTDTAKEKVSKIPEKITLPLIGEIQTKNISLPVLTLIIGALDGFNPCAMWTLLFLISLLLGMGDRKRMWILGGTFIVASAFVYFLFMAAWLNLLLFLGFVFWVRIMIALVALGGGGYYLKEYFTAEDATCKVTGTEKRQKVFERIRKITHESHFLLALAGIILLAFAVNLVEAICSAGLPVVYTQILSLSGLAKWQYYLYISFYIFIFMLDDLIVFFAAMITLRMTGLSAKYSRFSHLIGGAVMVIIGLLLIFKPELLMFG
jgi:thiol-disulfide isomerase/thioredoxin